MGPNQFDFSTFSAQDAFELAKIADPDMVMTLLDSTPGGSPTTSPAYAVQAPQADPIANAVMGPYSLGSGQAATGVRSPRGGGGGVSAPMPTMPQARNSGLDVNSLSLLAQMNRPAQRLGAPSAGAGPRPAQFQYQPVTTPPARRPDMASIIYGGSYGKR